MEKCDNNIDIEELSRRIEESIRKIENANKKIETNMEEVLEPKFSNEEIDRLIGEIDNHLESLKQVKKEDTIDIDLEELTRDINNKLDGLEDEETDDTLEKTLYDLSEISNMIKETLNRLEKDKEKKRKKAMYCDMARKNKKNCNKNNKKCNKKN